MVRLEPRRGRLILHLARRKFDWVIETRYWRNPTIGFLIWLLLPIVIYYFAGLIGLKPVALLSTLISANILAMICIPLTLQIIGTGRVNFGPHFFVAIGGYVAALLSKNFDVHPALTLFTAFAFGCLIGLALSPITIISKGLYFVLITLLLPFILWEFAYWRSDIFGAETGIPGVELLFWTGDLITDLMYYFYLSFIITFVLLLISDRVLRSRYGFLMGVINEDEEIAATYGINVNRIKIITFTLTSGAIAIAGWFLAHYQGSFTGPAWLTPAFLVIILLTTTLGGKGAIYGIVISSYVIAILREVTRTTLGEFSTVALFTILLIFLYLLPEGFWGLYRKKRYREYAPSIRIRRREVT
ncbi:MAG: branched-chain amino acid ABC transporter permease [Archaeoglobaceae archaeon]|nr:branched-chain amino acid ABC transporter permease [Archaeoglobaceae archaeon]